MLPLGGLTVVDVSVGIAGRYCAKLFVDAGAEVSRVEWSGQAACGPEAPLLAYLDAGKVGVRTASRGELAEAIASVGGRSVDLVIEDGQLSDQEVQRLTGDGGSTTVLSFSWFGRTSSWRDRPANEFTLQAASGSMMSRGTLDRPPLAAGGRLGEWIAGSYGAVIALAAQRQPAWRAHLDVSVFECVCLTMGGHLDLTAQMGQPRYPRYVELPSIERTRDGLVGFCTITRQQFSDFLVLIGHPELIEDEELATYAGRQARADSFNELVRSWASGQSTEDVLDFASALRIPVAPIGSPASVPEFEHFRERGVFCVQPVNAHGTGGFVRPRPPYRVQGTWLTEPRPAPEPGDGGIDVAAWLSQAPGGGADVRRGGRDHEAEEKLPLDGVRVVDLTAFWAGPSGTHLLATLGAEVIKVESPRRPDGMRFSTTRRPDASDVWWEWSPIFQWMNVNKRGTTVDIASEEGRAVLHRLLETSDLLIENFSPRVMENFGLDWEAIHDRHPHLVMLRMPAFGLDGPWRDRPGFAQTMEQLTGMAWVTGYPDRPPIVPKGPCDPTAGIHAAFAAQVGLRHRDRTGCGVLVEVPMVETALNISAAGVIAVSAGMHEPARNGNRTTVAAPQGAYPCAGSESWVAISVEDDDQWARLKAIAGEAPIDQPDWVTREGRQRGAELLDAAIAAWTEVQDAEDIARELRSVGIPAEALRSPYDLRGSAILRERAFFESVEHPELGLLEIMTLPLPSDPGAPWLRGHAPTLGQDNVSVFGEIGLSEQELDDLTRLGVIAQGLVTTESSR